MSTLTNIFKLIKPSLTDAADITATNSNLDIIENQLIIANKPIPISSTDGIFYSGTISGLTELYAGLTITVIPNKTSTSTTIKLNINSLGDVDIRQSVIYNTSIVIPPVSTSWFVQNKPVSLMYDGERWKTIAPRTNANDMYGTVEVENGGTGGKTPIAAKTNLCVAAVGKSTNSSISLPDGTITTIPLNDWDINITNDTGTSFTFSSDGGIICPYTGLILVSGNIYINAGGSRQGCYIYKNTTEVFSQMLNKSGDGSISTGAILIAVQDNDVIYLRGRCIGASNTAMGNVSGTRLSIAYI